MAETNTQTQSPLEQITQMNFSFAPACILTASLRLGLFSHMAAGRSTVADIARAAAASERGTRMLLDALAGFGLLSKSDERYELTPHARQYLVRESEDYAGGLAESWAMLEAWTHLDECVRTGRPVRRVEVQELAEEFFPKLVRTLHVVNREPARRTAAALGAGAEGLRVLDVACGSGVWGIAFAEADPSARITAQDFPGVLPTTREYVQRHGLTERFDFLPGDLKEVDFGEAQYDVALLGNIVHSEGEASSRDLFRRLRRALRPGGRLVVIDMIPNDSRTAPPYPLIFAINMLINTETGDTYTLAEYSAWLREAGFARVEAADIGSHSPAVIGHRD
ncbi:MAG TPA: methyltransferase [Pyrinomonadaceae bacterium]|jgi:ubiquinone/menaquinone biosynthesis C-methylase UbiE|nr:methyltransferase [Pyrinomonadaceae bacterium]